MVGDSYSDIEELLPCLLSGDKNAGNAINEIINAGPSLRRTVALFVRAQGHLERVRSHVSVVQKYDMLSSVYLTGARDSLFKATGNAVQAFSDALNGGYALPPAFKQRIATFTTGLLDAVQCIKDFDFKTLGTSASAVSGILSGNSRNEEFVSSMKGAATSTLPDIEAIELAHRIIEYFPADCRKRARDEIMPPPEGQIDAACEAYAKGETRTYAIASWALKGTANEGLLNFAMADRAVALVRGVVQTSGCDGDLEGLIDDATSFYKKGLVVASQVSALEMIDVIGRSIVDAVRLLPYSQQVAWHDRAVGFFPNSLKSDLKLLCDSLLDAGQRGVGRWLDNPEQPLIIGSGECVPVRPTVTEAVRRFLKIPDSPQR